MRGLIDDTITFSVGVRNIWLSKAVLLALLYTTNSILAVDTIRL